MDKLVLYKKDGRYLAKLKASSAKLYLHYPEAIADDLGVFYVGIRINKPHANFLSGSPPTIPSSMTGPYMFGRKEVEATTRLEFLLKHGYEPEKFVPSQMLKHLETIHGA